MCTKGFAMRAVVANLALSGKAPTALEDALRVCAPATFGVLDCDIRGAGELQRAREVRDELAAERGVDASPSVEHGQDAAVVARDAPRAGVVEALPVVGGLFDD